MDTIKIREGLVNLYVPNPDTYSLTAKMPVFYNSHMHLNRDISIILLRSLKRKFRCLDLLAASGARGLRLAAETQNCAVTINDANPTAVELAKENAKRNKLKVEILHESANRFLRGIKRKWDYIDIDPFGTPIPYLEAALPRLAKKGIIGVTATDTSALCGTYPGACKRKYNSVSLRCPIMHELGLRILIWAVQQAGNKQEIYLKPIFSHSTRHYMRVYFKRVDHNPKLSGFVKYDFKTGDFKVRKTKPDGTFAGPLWIGPLWDTKVVKSMNKDLLDFYKAQPIQKGKTTPKKIYEITTGVLKAYLEESKIDSIGFYDIAALAKIYKLPQLPKRAKIVEELEEKGYKAVQTHITPSGLRTKSPLKTILGTLR